MAAKLSAAASASTMRRVIVVGAPNLHGTWAEGCCLHLCRQQSTSTVITDAIVDPQPCNSAPHFEVRSSYCTKLTIIARDTPFLGQNSNCLGLALSKQNDVSLEN